MKNLNKYKLNLERSPFDARNWKYETLIRKYTYPETLDLRPDMFGVRDQGSQGSCAAMSGAAVKDWQEIKDVGITEYMSPQFIYNNRKNPGSAGMYLSDLMDILHKKGTCLESLHPYGNLNAPSPEAYADALNYLIENYAEVDTIEGLKQALYEKGACVIGVPVYNYTTRMWFKRPGDNYLGGHAMTIVGYNSEGFIIRNSWGDDWGDDGHTIFPYSDWGCQWEVWSSVDADSGVKPPPVPEPDRISKYWWIAGLILLAVILFFILKG